MSIWMLIMRLAFVALIPVAVYRQLLYLARIDFEPEPPPGPPSPVRIGEWILDIPELLEFPMYHVKLEIGDQVLFLSESLDGPPDFLTYAPYELRSANVRDLLVVSDLSEDLGRPASMEARFLLASRQGQPDYGRLALRVLIPQVSGFLALDNWLEVPDEALGNRNQLEEIIRDLQPLLIAQIKTVLSHYSWLGPDINEKPEGFMTRYGLLKPETSSFRVSSGLNLRYCGGGVLAPIQFIFTIRAGQGPKPIDPFDSHPSFYKKIKYLLEPIIGDPLKIQTGYRQAGGKLACETVIFFYSRLLDTIHTRMIWSHDPAPGDFEAAFLSCVFISNGFKPARGPEFLGLWRQVVDSAH